MTRTLAEYESKRLLAERGVPIADERVVETAEDAVAVARDFGGAVVVKLDASSDLSYDASSFKMVPKQGVELTGHVVAKGTAGTKLQLFPDDASVPTFRSFLAGLSTDAGNPPSSPVAETSKIILTLNEDLTGTLKIKAQLLSADGSTTLIKIKTTGEHTTQAN